MVGMSARRRCKPRARARVTKRAGAEAADLASLFAPEKTLGMVGATAPAPRRDISAIGYLIYNQLDRVE
jgi:hypothetical protein